MPALLSTCQGAPFTYALLIIYHTSIVTADLRPIAQPEITIFLAWSFLTESTIFQVERYTLGGP